MFGLGIGPFDIVKVLCGALIAFGLLAIYNVIIENPSVRREERLLVAAEARERALELMKKRSEDNAEISNMDLRQLCNELGGKWVSERNACD